MIYRGARQSSVYRTFLYLNNKWNAIVFICNAILKYQHVYVYCKYMQTINDIRCILNIWPQMLRMFLLNDSMFAFVCLGIFQQKPHQGQECCFCQQFVIVFIFFVQKNSNLLTRLAKKNYFEEKVDKIQNKGFKHLFECHYLCCFVLRLISVSATKHVFYESIY